jgi:hypothetical protein
MTAEQQATGTKQATQHVYIYIYVAIHALASMPSAPRLSEADSKTPTTGVPCVYALLRANAPSLLQNIAIALDTSGMLIIPQITKKQI